MKKIGLVGCGKVAAFHVYALQLLATKARLTAVFDVNNDRATQFGAANGGATAYTDLEEMAKEVDAAILCTPPMVREEAALAFLYQGKPVFVEKPFSSTLLQADRMLHASARTGAPIGVCCQRRWLPPMVRLYRAIEQGKLGKLVSCNATINGYRNDAYYEMDGAWRGRLKTEGGALLPNQAPHQTDLMLSLMGRPASVSANVANLIHGTIDGDDNVTANIRFESGAVGSVRYTNIQKPGFFGGIEVTDINGITVVVKTDGVMFVAGAAAAAGSAKMDPPSIQHWSDVDPDLLALWNATDRVSFFRAADPTMQFHVLALEDFLDAITAGRQPRINGEAGRQTVEFNTACYLSSARNMAPIHMPLEPAAADDPSFEGRRAIYRLPDGF